MRLRIMRFIRLKKDLHGVKRGGAYWEVCSMRPKLEKEEVLAKWKSCSWLGLEDGFFKDWNNIR